ncbi:MAG TPA: hypothetical protein VOB72_08670, partial [Candidatus Dormibacteraeota bacterium]|nr:hypothetical protein [Candidatus Dormibacteraeota bacterium]
TALIACARIGDPTPAVWLRRVAPGAELGALDGGRPLPRAELAAAGRWSRLFRPAGAGALSRPQVRLGSLARVSRGIATGANRFFVMTRERAAELGIGAWCRPVVTDAREILDAAGVVRDTPDRRVLLCLPADLDRHRHPAVDAYLRTGETAQDGGHPVSAGYLCAHRRPWFALGDPRPAPILASYMARQPPRFARNPDGLLHLNIAHGLYPRRAMSAGDIERLAGRLDAGRDGFAGQGRTYQGGLEKFEPREMEALLVGWDVDPRQGLRDEKQVVIDLTASSGGG